MVSKKNRKGKHEKKAWEKNAVKHPGSLLDVGFNEHESEKKQKQAIKRADKKYGRKETDLKLGFLKAVTKRYPKIHEKIKSVLKWNEKK